MRDYKFRGKRLDNGEWVYGNLIELRNPFNHEDSPACFIMPKEVNIADHDSIAEHEVVDPATIGQFTGLHDKNGKEIYEGDVVYIAGLGNTEMIFPFTDLYDSLAHTEYGGDIENVIGNIHDNPELLKQ